jgi:membrane-associated protein
MEDLFHLIKEVINPHSIIRYGGLAMLLFVVFAETGLFFGFFLPGDSLLFIAGLVCATSEQAMAAGNEAEVYLTTPIYLMVISIAIAGILGNFVGYWFGKRTGPMLFKRDDSIIFKKKYMEAASEFYDKHGGLAIILGRFMPIIRTFVPILAGVVKMEFKKFTTYNVTGSFLWVGSMCLSGYFLGRSFPKIQDYLEFVVIGIIILSMMPMIIAYAKKVLSKA